MAQEDFEVVRRMLAAFDRGDVEGVVGTFDDRCELHEPPEMPDRPVSGYRGHDGIREWMSNLRRTGNVVFEARGLEAHGNAILSELVGRGLGESSGAPFEWTTFAITEVRDGKIIRLRAFLTRAEALGAAAMTS